MNVKELIELLETFDGDCDVYVRHLDDAGKLHDVIVTEDQFKREGDLVIIKIA